MPGLPTHVSALALMIIDPSHLYRSNSPPCRRGDVSEHWPACASASTQLDFRLEQHPLPVFDCQGRRLPTEDA